MPKREKIPIEGLLEGYETALTEMGYSITTKLLLVRRAELIIRRHQNAGLAYFDQAIVNCYTGEIDDKYFKGNMQKTHYERSNDVLLGACFDQLQIPVDLLQLPQAVGRDHLLVVGVLDGLRLNQNIGYHVIGYLL